MEAELPYAVFFIILIRDTVQICLLRKRLMECGIKNPDHRSIGHYFTAGLYPLYIGRIMKRRKITHRASIGITLYKKFWGMGIGTAMFEEMLVQAKTRGTEQVELAYIEGNVRGKALYEKMGFSECGRMPRAFRFDDGSYHDEIFMIKYMNE